MLVYVSMSKFLLDIMDPLTNQLFIYSSQDMFYSYDGFSFQPYGRPMIEKSEVFRNFRDPNVLRYDDHYLLVMVENMRFGFYRSHDLVNWEKISIFRDEKLTGEYVELETPSLVQLGNETFLVHSAHRETGNFSVHNFYGSTRYYLGTFDGTDFHNEGGPSVEFDGPDLYAGGCL